LLVSETSNEPAREVALDRHWLHKGRVVLHFSGVDSIEKAETLRGLFVAIPAAERAPLADDSVYIADLIGCEVIDLLSPEFPIGKVTDFDHEAGLLIVQPTTGSQALIPFAKSYLVNIDLTARRIEMRLPDGLLDINAPVTDEERRELDTASEAERS
jgi:16S rRNA processing protein RimM